MNYKPKIRYGRAAVSVLLTTALLLSTATAAAGVYVTAEDGSAVQGPPLSSAFATGGSGDEQLSGDTYYAITGGGVELIEEKQTKTPEPLDVSGSLAVAADTIRVGLYYGGSDLDFANLANVVGSGYSFGYYDANRDFCELGYTAETAISMSTDTNVTVNGVEIYCFHIMLGVAYATFAEAMNVASRYPDGFPAYYNGYFHVLVGSYPSAAAADSAASSRGIAGTAFTASNRGVVVTKTGTSTILFEFDCGSTRSLAVQPHAVGDEKTVTLFKNYEYYGGFEYSRLEGEKLTVVNVVPLEEYVKGVIPYEMGNKWPLEALKALAVCARSYVLRNINSYASKYNFDVTNTAASQVYRGTNLANDVTDASVDQTAGVVVVYDGKICDTVYSSSHGGGSENSENVWGAQTPYLRGVIDPYEQAAEGINSYSSWTVSKSVSTVLTALSNYGWRFSSLTSLTPTLSDTGNAIALTFVDNQGRTVTVSGRNCNSLVRSYLGLPSIHFTVSVSGSSVVFTGAGWGHSLGLSQYGAWAMAQVYGYTYDEILNFYYTDISLCYGVAQ